MKYSNSEPVCFEWKKMERPKKSGEPSSPSDFFLNDVPGESEGQKVYNPTTEKKRNSNSCKKKSVLTPDTIFTIKVEVKSLEAMPGLTEMERKGTIKMDYLHQT